MTAMLFIILLVATLAAWFGRRQFAAYTYVINIVLASIWFLHHLTTKLNIQL